MSAWVYSIFGLRVWASRPVPGLDASPSAIAPDVQLWLGGEPPSKGIDGETASGDLLRFRYAEGVEFVFDPQGQQVWASGFEAQSEEDRRAYIVGPVLTYVLRLRGTICLHASAVAIDGRAVALLGMGGAGKSTTASALAARGWPVLSDDVVTLCARGDGFLVQPGYPRLWLRQDGAKVLVTAGMVKPHAISQSDKQYYPDLYLGRNGLQFQRSPLPLAAVYLMDLRRHVVTPEIANVAGRDGLMALLANTWVQQGITPAQRAEDFRVLGRLPAVVALRRVCEQAAPTRLARLCDMIIHDLRSGSTPPPLPRLPADLDAVTEPKHGHLV